MPPLRELLQQPPHQPLQQQQPLWHLRHKLLLRALHRVRIMQLQRQRLTLPFLVSWTLFTYFMFMDYICISGVFKWWPLGQIWLTSPSGDTQIWFGRGVPLEPQNPYPSVRVILAEMGTHCYSIGFFLKNRPIFQKFCDFQGFCKNPKIWAQSENWTHVKGFSL